MKTLQKHPALTQSEHDEYKLLNAHNPDTGFCYGFEPKTKYRYNFLWEKIVAHARAINKLEGETQSCTPEGKFWRLNACL